MTASTMTRSAVQDEAELRDMNAWYIQAVLTADADWYDTHLADDFICIRANGSVEDRAAFLAATRLGTTIEDYHLDDVTVRVHGDSAYVTALGSWRRNDGSTGQTRYLDGYVKTGSGWKVVSAHLTQVAAK